MRKSFLILTAALLVAILALTVSGAGVAWAGKSKGNHWGKPDPVIPGPSGDPWRLFAYNDSGMHCIDSDYSIFAILPPGNHVQAQVINVGSEPQLLSNSTANLTYQAIVDPAGSINTTSIGKTNFWTYVARLYSVALPLDTGFQGQKMPGKSNIPQPFLGYETATHRFTASGVPITPIDDRGNINNYPLMQVAARSGTTVMSTLSTVLPVSTEMHCNNCHATGRVAATPGFGGVATYSALTNLDLQTRTNILLLHDALNHTSLNANKPVRCSTCHYSAANDLLVNGTITATNLNPVNSFSRMIHGNHGRPSSLIGGAVPIPEMGIQTCYQCHPGQTTQCYRGAMFEAGLNCQACHGGLLQVAGATATGDFPDDAVVTWPTTTGQLRRPWIDLPLCQSCHSGDANNHPSTTMLIQRQAYDPVNMASASPRIATNKLFAEPNGGPGSLFNGIPMRYQDSLGHHGVACESCHGSPHAVWPTNQTNDNIAATQIQGHPGQIAECVACHGAGFGPITLGGPHGLHPINSQRFVSGHEDFAESHLTDCKACHGLMGEGTVLSLAQANRTFSTERGTRTIAEGTPVSCNLCHGNPVTSGGG